VGCLLTTKIIFTFKVQPLFYLVKM